MKIPKHLEVILKDIENKFELSHDSIDCLPGGYKNELWLISGPKKCVVKIFSKERFSNKQLDFINGALSYQKQLNEAGLDTPKVYTYDNKIIQEVSSIHYMLMDYFNGCQRSNETIRPDEMERLGQTCANIHHTLIYDDLVLHTDHLSDLSVFFDTLDDDKSNWSKSYEELTHVIKEIYRGIEFETIKVMDIGVTHSDFSNDNMLFSSQGISIIDFDRCRLSYQYQDIGRAIMSYAFNGRYIEKVKVDQFIKGYNTIHELTLENIIESLRLTWMIEVKWWMVAHLFNGTISPKIERFKNEIICLSLNWADLESIKRS